MAAEPPSLGPIGVSTSPVWASTSNTLIEALERAFPIRVLRYTLRRGSGGAGYSHDGDLLMFLDVTVSLITERRVWRPWGLAGGEPGAVGENWLLPQGDESSAERLLGKYTLRQRAGDVLRMLTPGGGGWGSPPAARDALAADRRCAHRPLRMQRVRDMKSAPLGRVAQRPVGTRQHGGLDCEGRRKMNRVVAA